MFANEALSVFSRMGWNIALDIGSGSGEHAEYLKAAFPDRHIITLDAHHPAQIRAPYLTHDFASQFDAIWCSHVLEHQEDCGAFIRKLNSDLKEGGAYAITVPPLKHDIVGGHVSLWNAGLLAYNLILGGFDLIDTHIWQYDYNISAVGVKRSFHMPHLMSDSGDIDKLAPFFPRAWKVTEGFHGSNIVTGVADGSSYKTPT